MAEAETYYIIWETIMRDKRLTSTDKLVFSRIQRLSIAKGYCYASNSYIGEAINVTDRTVQMSVNRLCKCKYCYIKRTTKTSKDRHIYINLNYERIFVEDNSTTKNISEDYENNFGATTKNISIEEYKMNNINKIRQSPTKNNDWSGRE